MHTKIHNCKFKRFQVVCFFLCSVGFCGYCAPRSWAHPALGARIARRSVLTDEGLKDAPLPGFFWALATQSYHIHLLDNDSIPRARQFHVSSLQPVLCLPILKEPAKNQVSSKGSLRIWCFPAPAAIHPFPAPDIRLSAKGHEQAGITAS